MTIREAKDIIDRYELKSVMTPDEEFLLTEAFNYIIEETKDTRYMVRLGGWYYEQKDFDLALKYYEMADSYGDPWAPEGLGYIWYYGRTGEKDYEKAFRCYSRAAANGFLRSKMKVADMYKNGYFVEKDTDKYRELIEELYDLVNEGYGWDEKNDIYIRLARIRKEQGRKEEAIELFREAREYLTSKLEYNPFFGDMNVMKWLMDDLSELTEPDMDALDIYDLYRLMKEPCKASFTYKGKGYEVESFREDDGSVSVRFGGRWYRDIDEFFKKAEIDGERIPVLYSKISSVKAEPPADPSGR